MKGRNRTIGPWLWVMMVLGVFVAAICIWLFLPLRHLSAPAYASEGAAVYVHTVVDEDSEAVVAIVGEARDRLLGTNPPFIARFAFRVGKRLIMPKRLAAWIGPGESPTEPGYVAAIDLGGGGRLVRTFASGALRRLLFDEGSSGRVGGNRVHVEWRSPGGFSPGAFAFRRDTLLLASDLKVLKLALASGASPELPVSFEEEIVRLLGQSEGLQLVADNSSGALGGIIRAAEEEFAFSLMPSADSLSDMTMTAGLSGGDASGTAQFKYDSQDGVETGYSDVRYLYGIIRRLLRPRGLDMDASIEASGLSIQFDFTVSDFLSVIVPGESGED